jgi:SAM-dependent methyltransferase
MQKWMLKAVIQKLISFLPGKRRLNYLFQKYITRGVQLSDAYFVDRLTHLNQHHYFFQKYGTGLEGHTLLELGTGWYPVIPVGFFLAGIDQVYTVDISPLMDREKVLTTLRAYQAYHQTGKLNDYLSFEKERMEHLYRILDHSEHYDFQELLRALNMTCLVADACCLPMPDCSFDFICSNNTFEHIYPDVLPDILREFKRLIRPDGVMSHFIDMSDHFAHLDNGITIYNFLRYSERAWKWIDNDIQPQNRWRISHYRALYRELGIPITEAHMRPGDLEALRKVPVSKPFHSMPEEMVAVSHGYLVSVMG